MGCHARLLNCSLCLRFECGSPDAYLVKLQQAAFAPEDETRNLVQNGRQSFGKAFPLWSEKAAIFEIAESSGHLDVDVC